MKKEKARTGEREREREREREKKKERKKKRVRDELVTAPRATMARLSKEPVDAGTVHIRCTMAGSSLTEPWCFTMPPRVMSMEASFLDFTTAQ